MTAPQTLRCHGQRTRANTKMSYLKLFCFLLVAPAVAVASEFNVTGDPPSVVRTEGDSANLIYHVRPRQDLTKEAIEVTVKWSDKKVHFFSNGVDDLAEQDDHFRNRTKLHLEGLSEGDILLELSNLSSKDNGNYKCMVIINANENNVDYHSKSGTVELVVNRKDNIGGHDGSDSPTPGSSDFPWWGWFLVVSVIVLIVVGLIIWRIMRNKGPPGNGGDAGVHANREDVQLGLLQGGNNPGGPAPVDGPRNNLLPPGGNANQ